MTRYSELTEETKVLVIRELKERGYPKEVINFVKNDYTCCACFMSFYNCLCSHED